MTTLDDFLALPDVDNEVDEVTMKRLGTLKVRPMTHSDFNQYQARARKKTNNGLELDTGKLNLLIVAGQTVEPDFSNADFLAKVKCNTATEFVTRKFKAGEIAELASKITLLSGFEVDLPEEVENAKN